jgi:hypothetical protein
MQGGAEPPKKQTIPKKSTLKIISTTTGNVFTSGDLWRIGGRDPGSQFLEARPFSVVPVCLLYSAGCFEDICRKQHISHDFNVITFLAEFIQCQ